MYDRDQSKGSLPKVSVIMPVYNGEEYLEQAIESILCQTFTDFELIVIDDGSTDNSLNIVKAYNDSRIVLLQNETNLKLISTLNRGINAARGKYIARMDADDISLPERFAVQVRYLDEHPDIALCGSWIEIFGQAEPRIMCMPEEPELVKCLLLFTNCIAHPSVMLRREMLGIDFWYSYLYPHAEDYALWVKLAKQYSIANIQQVLLKYRISKDQIGAKYKEQQWETVLTIQREQINALGIQPTHEETIAHVFVSFGNIIPCISLPEAALLPRNPTWEDYLGSLSCSGCPKTSLVPLAFSWFSKLKEANAIMHYYPEPMFTYILRAYWAGVCRNLSLAF